MEAQSGESGTGAPTSALQDGTVAIALGRWLGWLAFD